AKVSWMDCARTEFSKAALLTSPLTSSTLTYGIIMDGQPNTERLWEARILFSGTAIIRFCNILSKSVLAPRNCAKSMKPGVSWYNNPRMWVELFVLFNLAGLAPDILLAHRTNFFR